jgi:octaprenyl-diphosphate synthase
MNPVLATPRGNLTPAECFAPIALDLQIVDRQLRDALRSDAPYVDELLSYVADLGGKRMRPALLLLAAQACGGVQPDHHILAAVVEMIHTATLVHDDILDEAEIRRHRSTVHRRWGHKAAILLGDHLFSRAFHLTSTVGDAETCEIIGRSTNVVCEGELRQSGSAGNWDITEQGYYEIIGAKTAELCACCCELGARHAGAKSAIVHSLRSYGYNLGMAFQITDDLLDLTGQSRTAGKSLGTDLDLGKPTLPWIRFLSRLGEKDRAAWLQLLTDSANQVDASATVREELLDALLKSDALRYSQNKARGFADQAGQDLALLPPTVSRDSLRQLGDFVIQRAH